jgi:predicted nucleotidyltransferase
MLLAMKLVAQRERARLVTRRALSLETRERLRAALHELAPGHVFWVFGSLVRPGAFNAASDVDLAFESLPPGVAEFGLATAIEERVGRPVDLLDFGRSRLRAKIQREGERWIA